MRIPALCTLVIAAVLGLAGPAAAAGPAWCAAYRNGSTNCGFNTYEQCLAAISGIGGFCNRNYIDGPSDKPARARNARSARPSRKPDARTRKKSKNAWRRSLCRGRRRQPAPVIVQPQPMPVVVQPPAAPAQQPVKSFPDGACALLESRKPVSPRWDRLALTIIPTLRVQSALLTPKLGNPGEARNWYNRALAADPNHISTLVYSGALYVAQGDLAKARGDLDRIKAICGAAACPNPRNSKARSPRKAASGARHAAEVFLQHVHERFRLDFHAAGERVVDHDHRQQRGKDQRRKRAGHQRLRVQVLGAEEEGETHRDDGAAEQNEP